jgi:hypothetical protein
MSSPDQARSIQLFQLAHLVQLVQHEPEVGREEQVVQHEPEVGRVQLVQLVPQKICRRELGVARPNSGQTRETLNSSSLSLARVDTKATLLDLKHIATFYKPFFLNSNLSSRLPVFHILLSLVYLQ